MVSIHPSVVWTPCTLCISSCVWSACVDVFLDSLGFFCRYYVGIASTPRARVSIHSFIRAHSRAPRVNRRARVTRETVTSTSTRVGERA